MTKSNTKSKSNSLQLVKKSSPTPPVAKKEKKLPVKMVVCPPFLLLYCPYQGQIRAIPTGIGHAFDITSFFTTKEYTWEERKSWPSGLRTWYQLPVEEQADVRLMLQGQLARNQHKLEEIERLTRNVRAALDAITRSPDLNSQLREYDQQKAADAQQPKETALEGPDERHKG